MPFEGENGEKGQSIFHFVVAGDKLTGTEIQNGVTRDIEDGEVRGATVRFFLRQKSGHRVEYEGAVQADEIHFKVRAEADAHSYSTVAYRVR
jgi:hypothetical protein